MKRLKCAEHVKWIRGKKGSEMVEGSFVLPLIVLVIVLFLRIFAFYLNILTAQFDAHCEAVEIWDSYKKPYISVYRNRVDLELPADGILSQRAVKSIEVKAVLVNEDLLVRSGEILNE